MKMESWNEPNVLRVNIREDMKKAEMEVCTWQCFGKDLAKAVLVEAPYNAVYGALESLVNPFTIPMALKRIHNRYTDTLSSYAGITSRLAVYTYFWVQYIDQIKEHPDNPFSYFPLITNLLGGIGIQVANKILRMREEIKRLQEKQKIRNENE